MPWTGKTPRARAAAARAKAMYMKKAKAANTIKRYMKKSKFLNARKGYHTIPSRKPYFIPYSKFYLAGLRKRSYGRYRRR